MIYGRIRLRADGAAPPPDLAPFRGARPAPAPGQPPLPAGPREGALGRGAFGHLPDGVPGLDRSAGLHLDGQGMAVAQGFLSNRDELLADLESRGQVLPDNASLAALLLGAVRAHGEEAPAHLEGTVAFAACLGQDGPALVSRDRLGVEPLFVAEHDGDLLFCSRARGLADACSGRRLNGDALREYLLLGYLVGEQTLFEGVRRLGGGRALRVADGGSTELSWWDPAPGETPATREEAIELLRELMIDAVERRSTEPGPMGVFLSGGLDSSAVTALLSRRKGDSPPATFSFRCRGESYDESYFAGLVAERFGTEHHLTEYSPERMQATAIMAAEMDEPFADIGINTATWILAAEAARAGVSLILTGDGGDELFCGHPVYAADRLARRMRWLPGPLLRLAARPLTGLADSEAKKDLRVKLKRFSMGLLHPSDLGPSRWRFHSSPAGLEMFLTADAPPPSGGDLYAGIRHALAGAGSALDAEGRVVLADYRIVVEFYLRRLILARRFGIEARVPWLDRRLVELAAALPAAWRVEGLKDEKVLMKPVIEPWLPREVVHRPDKLGHSVPFKNWLRTDPAVRGVVDEALSEASLKRRGLIDPSAVARLRAEHDSGRENRSHRIWTLTVLEYWLRGNLDR